MRPFVHLKADAFFAFSSFSLASVRSRSNQFQHWLNLWWELRAVEAPAWSSNQGQSILIHLQRKPLPLRKWSLRTSRVPEIKRKGNFPMDTGSSHAFMWACRDKQSGEQTTVQRGQILLCSHYPCALRSITGGSSAAPQRRTEECITPKPIHSHCF